MKLTFICLLLTLVKENEGGKCRNEVSNEGKLREDLFCNYHTNVRPVKHQDNITIVYFQLFPVKLYVDEHEELLSFEGNFFYSWNDQFLKWDPREYEGIDFLAVDSSAIWVPHVALDSWLQSSSILTDSDSNTGDCHVTHTGEVYCFSRATFQTHCTPDLTYFPYDIQNCTLVFLPTGVVLNRINFTLYDTNNGIKLVMYKPNKAWELLEARAVKQVKYLRIENESLAIPYIRCYFVLRRHSALDSAVYILPGAALACLCLTVFWMNTMYSHRVGVAATVLMANTLYCLILGLVMPPSGDRVPLIVTFYRDSLVIASFTIAVTVFVRHLRLKSESPSHWLTGALSKMESMSVVRIVFLGGSSAREEEDSEEMIENSKTKNSAWHEVATFVDRISFFVCSFAYVLLFLIYLP